MKKKVEEGPGLSLREREYLKLTQDELNRRGVYTFKITHIQLFIDIINRLDKELVVQRVEANEIERLARFILKLECGYPKEGMSAVDSAIAIITELAKPLVEANEAFGTSVPIVEGAD